MKFTFEKPFNFSRFPSILKCHEHYNQLVEESYYTEARYEDGKCSKDEWAKALDICDEYYVGEYAHAVFQEFSGHGLYVKDWRSKKIMKFDDCFNAPFDTISLSKRRLLVSLVELKYALRFTADFYEKS